MTKWWKCDLQLATPAWNFQMPVESVYDLATDTGKRAFANRYMDELEAKGVEVIALADHNTGEWIDIMVEAGQQRGIAVFPGCEITTGSGADGIHILIVGARHKTSRDFDLLLAGVVGFDDVHHPRYHIVNSKKEPGSSGKTLLSILDDLPDDYLAIAPHALTDNGVASKKTAKGDIRWKALHHPRLAAIDPGDCSDCDGSEFNDRFRRRDLDQFPRLKELAYVSTSDAYKLADVGCKCCWIRMETPTFEALRQAFLDHETRVICCWDKRLQDYPNENPNRIRHAWIERVELNGTLGNSAAPFAINFHPGLNVVIGGRGSGKSTVVAALRQLYSGFSTLPPMVRQEAENFSERIFAIAELAATHRIQNSQEAQRTVWSKRNGSLCQIPNGSPVPTAFRVRVVNQKELFERVSHDRSDPMSASRSFLAFVDESLGFLKTTPVQPGSWWRRYEDACANWMSTMRDHQKLAVDVAQLPSIREQIRELEAQVAAFDAPEAKARRRSNEVKIRQLALLNERKQHLKDFFVEIENLSQTLEEGNVQEPAVPGDIQPFVDKLDKIEINIKKAILDAAVNGRTLIEEWASDVQLSPWMSSVEAAQADEDAYLEELKGKGIDPEAYTELKQQLAQQHALEKALMTKELSLQAMRQKTTIAWQLIRELLSERRDTRSALLEEVSIRSGRIKFSLRTHHDALGWTRGVRELLNLRADGFLEDVPDLAGWLWNAPDESTLEVRWALWRQALVTGDFNTLGSQSNAHLRSAWQRRLESLDETLKLRLATEVADDSIQISFLKDGGRPDHTADWQDITQGSPGQRTAAMLGFVLHHGVEPLVLDQPEDDLDTEWISTLVVRELRASRSARQIIVVTHNANIPVNGDAERVIVLENNTGIIRLRCTVERVGTRDEAITHCGAIENANVRADIQNIMEGGIRAFVLRERKYNTEVILADALRHRADG